MALLLAGLGAGLASAQPAERPQRPFRGLFGGDERDPRSRHRLDFNVSLEEAYDDNITAEGAGSGVVDPRFHLGGFYSGLGARLTYTRRGDAVSFFGGGGTALRYYPQFRDLAAVSQYARVGLNASLGRRLSVRVAETATYSPFYVIGVFPDFSSRFALDEFVPSVDYTISARKALASESAAALTYRLTTRTSADFSYVFRNTDFVEDDSLDLKAHLVGGRLTHQVTRHASVRAGYAYGEGLYGFYTEAGPVRNHNIDIGADYNRALSVSRRTTFGFAFGSAVIANEQDRLFRLNGDASLTHEMGRTWTARLTYRRGVGYVEGFSQPFFSDSVSADLNGHVSRRLEFNALAGYSTGEIGFVASSNYDTYRGSLRLRFALSRLLATYGEYFYYHYEFPPHVSLPAGLPRSLDRQGARVGLSFWLPLLR